MERLGEIAALPLDGLTKGVPNGVAPLRLGDVAAKRWNLLAEDLPLPAAVLKDSALEGNERWMHAFLAGGHAVIAPHGKTTMSPQLFARQLAHGAWAITVATMQQLEVALHFGAPRIVLANQIVGRQAVRFVAEALSRPGVELYALVDSLAGVELLRRGLAGRTLASPLNLLLEIGHQGGRTGCRDQETALAVARAVKAGEPSLRLRGVEGFEGLFEGPTPEAQEAGVAAFLDAIVAVAEAAAAEGLFGPGPVILSAGGSAFYDMVVERFGRAKLAAGVQVLTRSGCYLSHDSGIYRKAYARARERSAALAGMNEGPRHALEVWAYVQSRPEPGKVVLTMGKRDVSYDAGLPVPELWHRPGAAGRPGPLPAGHVVTGLNDQHAHMTVPPDSPLQVGDMVGFGISHPCLTFDKWQVLFVVDDDYTVIDAVRTYF